MRYLKGSLVLVVTGLLVLGGCATGGQEDLSNFEAERVSLPEYREFLDELATSLSQGEPRAFNQREVDRFNELSGRLDEIMKDYESIDEMSNDERMALFNAHEALQALVVGQRENQVICSRRHTVGTNFKVSECYTRAEWQQKERQSQEWARSNLRQPPQRLPEGPGGP